MFLSFNVYLFVCFSNQVANSESLYLLPTRFRINSKVLLITDKGLYTLAPSYFTDLLCFSTSTRTLGSPDH